jgi:hypothetical protein
VRSWGLLLLLLLAIVEAVVGAAATYLIIQGIIGAKLLVWQDGVVRL